MKKKIVWGFLIIVFITICIGESRSFFCLGDNKCVTVWKTYGGACYVIPGKYYGLIKPRYHSYIQTTNRSGLDIIWPKDANTIIIDINDSNCVINNNSEDILIINYSSKEDYYNNLFTHFDGKYHRYNRDVSYMNISIAENVAVDSKGNKL